MPIPGVSALIDIPLLLGELAFQRKQLQIGEAAMKKHKETFGPEFKEKLEALVEETSKLYLVGLTADSVMKVAALIAATVVASEAAESALMVIPIVGWIVGSIVGAGLSAAVTYRQLTTALDAHKEISLNTTQVVTELRVRA